jgi:uncharacterized protein
MSSAPTSSDPAATSSQVPLDVYTGQTFYVPAFQIVIKGQELPLDVSQDVVSVSYTDSLTDIDSCDIVVSNWDPDKATNDQSAAETSPFKYSDSTLFNPWQGLELYMGYVQGGQRPIKMLTGEITTMTPNFPSSGASTLSVRALNLLNRFRTSQKTKTFINRKDSEIAQMIVQDIASEIRTTQPALTLMVDDDELQQNLAQERPLTYLTMHSQYPLQFLLQRSRDNGYELFLTEDSVDDTQRIVTLHYRPTAAVNQVFYRLAWGETLLEFSPTLQTANQVSSVTVRGWDPKGKTKIEQTFNRKDLQNVVQPEDLNIPETNLAQKLEITVDKPIQDDAEATRIAQKRALQNAQEIVSGRGKTVGLPNLRSGNKIQIEGLGQRFSGVYVVTSTTHTIGEGGYTTDFSARMESTLSTGGS